MGVSWVTNIVSWPEQPYARVVLRVMKRNVYDAVITGPIVASGPVPTRLTFRGMISEGIDIRGYKGINIQGARGTAAKRG